ncbi:MAG: DNA-binding protein [Firmicutes bacterium HGW-Firmicutes-15]|nr:MAG: DNA-binding protein [Firmicutes bacterium HGW-Firmicutes-15]
MQYQKASLGRVIVAKIEHGDDLLEELQNLLRTEQIQAGLMFMIGALQGGSLVVGPEDCTVPPQPVWKEFQDGRELLGMATVFTEGSEPVIHLHASLGRGEEPLTGCIRKDARVYLVVEVIVLELLDSGAIRTLDALTGLNLLGFA